MSSDDKESLKELARGIVLAQGNIHIKELLRTKGIPIGRTKADFERHLVDAIEAGQLTRADFDEWLDNIEGWGDQHVYLYNVTDELVAGPIWHDSDAMRRKVEDLKLASLWYAPISLAFPKEPELTRIAFDGTRFQLLWHEGTSSWVRTPPKDYEEEMEGDRYQFRAYRWRDWRSVLRFELDLKACLAALFLSIRIDVPKHKELIGEAFKTVREFLDLAALRKHPVLMANVIKNLDQAQVAPMAGAKLNAMAHSTRLKSGVAYVQFASTSDRFSYWDSTPVKEVRLAVRPANLGDFIGSDGTFEFRQTGGNRLSRDVRVRLFGEDKRVRFWARLKADDVWKVLGVLRDYQ